MSKINISKAIEIQSDPDCNHIFILSQDGADAIQLGIEALKRIQRAREKHLMASPMLLPGETLPGGHQPSEDELKRIRESPLGKRDLL